MPTRVEYYRCNYCKRKYADVTDAEVCEEECAKVNECTTCTGKCPPGMWRRSVDAAGTEHFICPRCWREINNVG